jgi:gamma-glutamylcyclotransferase
MSKTSRWSDQAWRAANEGDNLPWWSYLDEDDDGDVTGGLYFAYGANLDKLSMCYRCPAAAPISRAWIPNWQLAFKGVCDIEKAEGAVVHGGLWAITMQCERSLDIFEGAPDFYRKETLTVMTATGPYEAMVYIMNDFPGYIHGYDLPSMGYYHSVETGYKDFDLPIPALHEALDRVPEPVYVPPTIKAVGFTATQEDWEKGLVEDCREIITLDEMEWEEVYADDLYDDGDAYEAGLLDRLPEPITKSPATMAMDNAELEEKIAKALDRSDSRDKLSRLRARMDERRAQRMKDGVMMDMARAMSDGEQ